MSIRVHLRTSLHFIKAPFTHMRGRRLRETRKAEWGPHAGFYFREPT
jgi:hypothetical protein